MSATRVSTTPVSGPKASVDAMNAEFLRALGHPMRVRVLELLRSREEMSVRELQAALRLDSGGASQHLSAMRRQGVLATRRQGTSVFYRMRDPRTFRMLEIARDILTSHVQYTQRCSMTSTICAQRAIRPGEQRAHHPAPDVPVLS